MKNLRVIALLLAATSLLGSRSMAKSAPSNDWQVLKGIPAGTEIDITFKHKPLLGHCEFEEATDDSLACYYTFLGSRQFARDNVRAVRLTRHTSRIGFAVGSVAGAIMGAAHDPGGSSRAGNAALSGVLLGGVGAWIGWTLHPLFHGRAIYRSTDLLAAKAASKTWRATPRKEAAGEDSSSTGR